MRAATRLKMGAARRGRLHSQESKERIGAANRARHALWREHAAQAAAEQQQLGQARPDLRGVPAGRRRRATDPREGLDELALEQAVSELIGLRREVRCSFCAARPAHASLEGHLLMLSVRCAAGCSW